jgi:hypothetical protein
MVQRIAATAVLGLLACAPSVSAQEVRGFASGGFTTDVNAQRYPAFGGGAVVSLGQPWVSAGVQADAFVSWPYFSGRGVVFGQGNLAPRKPISPFVLAGYGFGEDSGPMIGAGIDLRAPNQRIGFRLAVEDYVLRYRGYQGPTTSHQIAFRAGILF